VGVLVLVGVYVGVTPGVASGVDVFELVTVLVEV
jgi:hypothetical protein